MNKIISAVTYGNKTASAGNMDEWQRTAHPWTVVLRYKGRQMTVEFWTGAALGEPSTHDVVACLASDAAGFQNARSFEEWASEYGYDEDSRKAERIYRQVERQTRKLENLLGDDFERIIYTDEDELKVFCEGDAE